MPRQARSESETGYYHIMIRGINKEKIFATDQEKERIVTLIREKTQEEACRIIAYCIMDNHMHMIIHAEKSELVKIMKKINISYAMSYNQRHKRIGPVFQDRFRSENITDESYLYGAIRYIHNNPIEAGMVSKVEEYKWSSIREYLSNENLLLDQKAKEEIMLGFVSNKEFLNFHDMEDNTEYLEIKEEAEEMRTKRAEKIMEQYFEEKGITDRRQINTEELIIHLLKNTNLSYRKIGEIIGVNVGTIHRVNKKNRP